MPTTLDDLERRVAALEQALASLHVLVERRIADETATERGARMLREAKASHAASAAAAAKAFAEMGIPDEPVTHEQLREMWAQSGIDPEENLFSREIIAMR